MMKNLTITMGNCNHHTSTPTRVELVRTRALDPTALARQHAPVSSGIEAYDQFDGREQGWLKVARELAA